MTVESQLCPQCGHTIQFGKGQTKAVCAYCGTTVVKSTGVPSLKKEIEGEKLGQEVMDREILLHSEGRSATAKILSVQKTDIFRLGLNGKAMLMSFTVEVQTDNEVPFNAETKAWVGLVGVDNYKPGTVLDVRYDPKDHTQVSVEGRHDVPASNPWLPDEQQRKADEMIRKGNEMIRKADEEYKRGEEEYRQGEEEYDSSDTENDGSVKARKRPKKAQSQAAASDTEKNDEDTEDSDEDTKDTDEDELPTPAWGKPSAAGAVPVPAQFASVTNLGAPAAVYSRQGSMLFAALGKTKPKELVLYQDGLAFHTGGKEIYAWHWPEVASILTHLSFHPGNATMGRSDYVSNEITLLKGNGEKLIVDDALGSNNEIKKLIGTIKKAVYALLYPPLAQRYGAGQAVTFGPVTVHRKNGLEMGGKTYAWADISDVDVKLGQLIVTMRNHHTHEVRTTEIPNVELLCRLIGVELDSTKLWSV